MYGELCGSRNHFAVCGVTGRERNWKAAVWKGLSRLVTWIGLVVIALLALPVGILALLLFAVWSLTDTISSWIGQKGEN